MEPTYRATHARFQRSIFAVIGLRKPAAQHTFAEGQALRRNAAGARSIVEIGVAEGGSAWELRHALAEAGTLYLIDPYHLSRNARFSPARLTAKRLVGSAPRGSIRWIFQFSHQAAASWNEP